MVAIFFDTGSVVDSAFLFVDSDIDNSKAKRVYCSTRFDAFTVWPIEVRREAARDCLHYTIFTF